MIWNLHLSDDFPFDLATEVYLLSRLLIYEQSCVPEAHDNIDMRLRCLSSEYGSILKVKLNEYKLACKANNIPFKPDIIAPFTFLIQKLNLYRTKFNHIFDKLVSKLLLILFDWLYPINLLLL